MPDTQKPTKTIKTLSAKPPRTMYDKIGPVRVMAVAEGWAMVRRKGAMPFVVHLKELSETPTK